MMRTATIGSLSILVVCLLHGAAAAGEFPFPADPTRLEKTISYPEMTDFLRSIEPSDMVEVSTVGESVRGRPLFLIRVADDRSEGKLRIFFFAQQHGDEPAGKDALLTLLRHILEKKVRIPDGLVLYLMPMVNPDGAEAGERRNAAGADLNRDHRVLSQPETRILHRVFRDIMPHLAVDCHEFSRDSRAYRERGWLEWPEIMLDCLNHPLCHPDLLLLGLTWVQRVSTTMDGSGFNFTRYVVGGVPPLEEMRHSTPELDDARNAFGAYGALTFIIETGFIRSLAGADLGRRVDATLTLLRRFILEPEEAREVIKVVETARRSPVPPFIPTNQFWASRGFRITPVKVIDRETGKVEIIRTANFMSDVVVKGAVSTPEGYVIAGTDNERFRDLFAAHGIPCTELERPQRLRVEPCVLERFEDEWDPVYARYGGRQIVRRQEAEWREFPPGSLVVAVDLVYGLRVAALLEPTQLYGLFSQNPFRGLVRETLPLPVYRLVGRPDASPPDS